MEIEGRQQFRGGEGTPDMAGSRRAQRTPGIAPDVAGLAPQPLQHGFPIALSGHGRLFRTRDWTEDGS